jgi:hypothetical protein
MVGEGHARQRDRCHAFAQAERVEHDVVQAGAHAVQRAADGFG